MQNITDVDTFTMPVTAILDGDDLDDAHLVPPIQALANRTRYIQNRLLPLASNTVIVPFSGMPVYISGSPVWTSALGVSGGLEGLVQGVDTTVPFMLALPWAALFGVKITDITVYSQAAAHGALPGTMPSISLVEIDLSTHAVTTIQSKSDPAVTTGTYDDFRTWSMALSDEYAMPTDAVPYIALSGEHGANYASGYTYYCGVKLTVNAI